MTGIGVGETALLRSADPRRVAAAIMRAHEQFLAGADEAAAGVRSLIVESWRRSLGAGLDPTAHEAPFALRGSELVAARDASPMALALPVVRSLLTEHATDAGHIVAIGDDRGRLLWVEGDAHLRDEAQTMGFAEGALWGEEHVGTNAPGTALATNKPVQIFAAEHYLGVAQTWSCVAVPVHDPHTGRQIGVVDVTGHDAVAGPHALAMVRATVAAIEADMRHSMLPAATGGLPPAAASGLLLPPGAAIDSPTLCRLEVLGRDRALLTRGGATDVLSTRHSELLLLLAFHPRGVSAERLAVMMHEHDIASVTIRSEMTRLRRVLGADALLSKPYRLAIDIEVDAITVRDALQRGDLTTAIAQYTGPVMPSSESPEITDLRIDLSAMIRRAVLSSADPEALVAFAQTADGQDDEGVLRAAIRALPPTSPRRPALLARLDYLDRVYG